MKILEKNGQIEETFRALTKNDILKPYLSSHNSLSTTSNDVAEDEKSVGYIIYVFDVRYQKSLGGAQQIKIEFELSEENHAGIYG